ncbi:MAG: hypothetical protein IKB43_08235 [Fibrobacter sp.]|nr:hypothetical protein [Fibrobacter sp.]
MTPAVNYACISKSKPEPLRVAKQPPAVSPSAAPAVPTVGYGALRPLTT